MNRPNHNRWESLQSVLAGSLGPPGTGSAPSTDWVSFHWNLIVGRELTAVTRVKKITGKGLVVTVSDRKWFPALEPLRAKITAEVNRRAGTNLIDRIHFEEGPMTDPSAASIAPGGNPNFKECIPSEEKCMPQDESLQEILDRISRKFMILPLAAIFLVMSNCTTLPTGSLSEEIDLSGSYAVKTIEDLNQKKTGETARDPRAYFHYLMALKEIRQHQFEKAADHFREVASFDPENSMFHRQLAMNLLRSGQLDKAYQVLEESLHHFPDNPELNMMMGDILVGRQEYERSLNHYQRVIEVEPGSARAYLLRGTVYEHLKQFDLATGMYRQVVQVEPGNPLGYHYLARMEILSGKLQEAKRQLNQTLELRPNLLQTRKFLAWVWEQLGQVEEAVKEYQILLKLDPMNKKIHDRLTAMPNFPQPADVTTAAYRSDAEELLGPPQVHLKIGAVYYEQALYLKALDEFQLIRSREQTKEVLMVLSRVYEILGRVDKAIEELEALEKMEPLSVNRMIYAARLYSMNSQPDETIRLLQEAIDSEPKNDTLHHSLALAYMAVDRFDDALGHMQTAISLNENKDSYYFELGALLERAGQYENAIHNMKRAIELNPMHSNAHNFLGYMYALQGKSLDKALDHLQKALSIQPRNGYFLDSLGWIYFKKGEPERALEEMKKAMVYTSPDPVLYSHLGDIYFSLKDYAAAGKAWRTSLFLTQEKVKDLEGEMPNPGDLEKKIKQAQDLLNAN